MSEYDQNRIAHIVAALAATITSLVVLAEGVGSATSYIGLIAITCLVFWLVWLLGLVAATAILEVVFGE